MFDQKLVQSDLPLGQNITLSPNSRFFNLRKYITNVDVAKDNSEHAKTIDRNLLQAVGYNQDNQYLVLQDNTDPTADQKIKLGSYFYNTLGGYSTGSYVRPTIGGGTMTFAPPMTVEQLQTIAYNIMFEAVEGEAGLDFKIQGQSDFTEAEARMALPSPQRLGKRVKFDRFTPAYQIKKLFGVEKPKTTNTIDNSPNLDTYGSFYNPYAQFDSLISLGQIALCIGLILGFVILLDIVAGLVKAINPSDTTRPVNFEGLSPTDKQRLLGTAILQDSSVYPLAEIDGGDIVSQILGTNGMFSPTYHNAEECLGAGIQEFFGFSFYSGGQTAGPGALQQFARTALKVLTENGRINVTLREIVRSGITLIEDTASDFTGGFSIAALGKLIRKLIDLKIVKLINVLMQTGDRIKFEDDLRREALGNGNGDYVYNSGSNVSFVDSYPDDVKYFIAKSRLSDGSLAWKNSSLGMLGLDLKTLIDSGRGKYAGQVIGGVTRSLEDTHWRTMNITLSTPSNATTPLLPETDVDKAHRYFDTRNNGRLRSDLVAQFEQALEADYMPFSFQDLRTNEIIPLHAFLEDVSDDFSVEYSSQDGYGRMDKVQIYKGTTRTVNVSFKMVATNPQDHDDMWYKINKLAMFIYPQWTQGRKISIPGTGIKFIQPFSQIPGATPVIRMRLGDLYKTNYSKMAVARLFGVSTLPDYNVTGNIVAANQQETAPADADTNAQRDVQRLQNFMNVMQAGQFAEIDGRPNKKAIGSILRQDELVSIYPFAIASQLDLFGINRGTGNTNERISTNNNNGRIIAIYKGLKDVTVRRRVQKHAEFELSLYESIRVEDIPDILNGNPQGPRYPIGYINNLSFITDFANPSITIPINQLHQALDKDRTSALIEQTTRNNVNAENSRREASRTTANNNRNSAQNLLDPDKFYSPTSNPIMKAFNASGGKGLAGVVTNFKINYGEAKGNWGTDGTSKLRAPMFVTIDMTLAVIHDITPGLDANGVMWAPIWPVGPSSNFFVNNGVTPPSTTSPPDSPAVQPLNKETARLNRFDVGENIVYYNRKG